jgi:hypothetical protein
MKKAKVAIITALPEEITAVEEHLNDLIEETTARTAQFIKWVTRKTRNLVRI